MDAIPQLIAAAGYTHFSGVFSTVFPLVILILVLIWYVFIARAHP